MQYIWIKHHIKRKYIVISIHHIINKFIECQTAKRIGGENVQFSPQCKNCLNEKSIEDNSCHLSPKVCFITNAEKQWKPTDPCSAKVTRYAMQNCHGLNNDNNAIASIRWQFFKWIWVCKLTWSPPPPPVLLLKISGTEFLYVPDNLPVYLSSALKHQNEQKAITLISSLESSVINTHPVSELL